MTITCDRCGCDLAMPNNNIVWFRCGRRCDGPTGEFKGACDGKERARCGKCDGLGRRYDPGATTWRWGTCDVCWGSGDYLNPKKAPSKAKGAGGAA